MLEEPASPSLSTSEQRTPICPQCHGKAPGACRWYPPLAGRPRLERPTNLVFQPCPPTRRMTAIPWLKPRSLRRAPDRLLELVGRLASRRASPRSSRAAIGPRGHARRSLGVVVRAAGGGPRRHGCPGPLVVVCPTPDDVDELLDDLGFSRRTPERFPAWETLPGERVMHDEVFGDRVRLLKRLAGRPSRRSWWSPASEPVAAGPQPGDAGPADAIDPRRGTDQRRGICQVAGRKRVPQHVGGGAAGRVLRPRRDARHLRPRLVRSGPRRVVRRRDRVDPPFRGRPASGAWPTLDSGRRDDARSERCPRRAHLADYLPAEQLVPAGRAGRDWRKQGRHYLERARRPQELHSVPTPCWSRCCGFPRSPRRPWRPARWRRPAG